MAQHNVNPVREQIRTEMLAALAKGAAMTATELYALCPSATESTEIARIAHDMRRTGKLDTGEQVIHPLGMRVNTYRLPTTEDPRIEASKPIKVERKIPKTGKANKPRASNPYAQFTVSKPQEAAPRVTRDLPQHLQSATPTSVPAPFMTDPLSYVPDPAAAARCLPPRLQPPEPAMSEDPMPYSPDPDSFALEPRDPEAEADIDSDLVDALLAMAHLEPKDAEADAVLAMASADVGEITAAMAKRQEAAPKKVCKCIRLNSLPPLPRGYRYTAISVDIMSDEDGESLNLLIADEGNGPFAQIDTTGKLRFDLGELALIGEAADALIKLHEDMNHE